MEAGVVVAVVSALGFNRAHGWIAFGIGMIGFVTVCLAAEVLHRRDARHDERRRTKGLSDDA